MIGVLVLTGFLGSGKTTLLRHLLRQPEFSRTAVIINEFGEIGLDHELVEASADSFIELANGCLCCRLRSDLADTIAGMLGRRDRGMVPPFSRIVIETSGLADPAPILQTLMVEPYLAGRLKLSGVVTTVDAVNGASTLEREQISVKQAALADRLVVTKSDLAGPAASVVLNRLAGLNAKAPVAFAHHGRVDPRILDIGAFEPRASRVDLLSWLGEGIGGDRHLHAHHDPAIQTYAILRNEPIRAVALTLFLETLAEHCGSNLLRLKGIVNVMECLDRPAIIHGVQHVFHPPEWLEHWPSDDRRSRIVLITRRIPRRWVELLLEALDAEVTTVSAQR